MYRPGKYSETMDQRRKNAQQNTDIPFEDDSTDPVIRLQKFCERAQYEHTYYWDIFKNAICIKCKVWSGSTNDKKFTVCNRSLVVGTTSIQQAKRSVSCTILFELGLTAPPQQEEEPSQKSTHEAPPISDDISIKLGEILSAVKTMAEMKIGRDDS